MMNTLGTPSFSLECLERVLSRVSRQGERKV